MLEEIKRIIIPSAMFFKVYCKTLSDCSTPVFEAMCDLCLWLRFSK